MTEKELPNCINCAFEYIYEVKDQYVCPECNHEWSQDYVEPDDSEDEVIIKDAYGVVLNDGDNIVVIKDLKIKGGSSSVKVGTKIKNIRLVAGDHDIDCRIPGIGSMGLKSEFVKKA